MPILHSVVPEADSCIYMPILQQVAHHLVNSLNINEYIKNNIFIETGWTAAKGTRKSHSFFTRTDSLKIVAEQLPFKAPAFDHHTVQFAGGNQFRPSLLKESYYQLLMDNSAEIHLFESIFPASFSLNCTLWFRSRNVAYETIKKLALRFNSGDVYSLSLTYDYPVPKDIVNALVRLFQYRKIDKQDPQFHMLYEKDKKITFAEWLDKASKAFFVTTMSRARPNDKELCIAKTIDNGLMQIEFEQGKPEDTKLNNVVETYNINFNVKIQFEEASAVILEYPCVVDNNVLGKELIPELRRNDTPITSQLPQYNLKDMNHFYHDVLAAKVLPNGIVQFPFYDDWKVPFDVMWDRSYRPFFISLYYKDEDSDYLTLDLKEPLYGEQCLHPRILDILRMQGNGSFDNDCICNISSYMRGHKQIKTDMYLEDDLLLKIRARDIHPQRHLVLYQITDDRYLHPKYKREHDESRIIFKTAIVPKYSKFRNE